MTKEMADVRENEEDERSIDLLFLIFSLILSTISFVPIVRPVFIINVLTL